MSADLSEGLCVKHDQAELWDLDAHYHGRLGRNNACWMCEEAEMVCLECPVYELCYKEAQDTREQYMIRAGYAWTHGRPVSLRRRRAYS